MSLRENGVGPSSIRSVKHRARDCHGLVKPCLALKRITSAANTCVLLNSHSSSLKPIVLKKYPPSLLAGWFYSSSFAGKSVYIEIYRYINAASTQCSGDVNPMCCSHTVGTLYVGLCGGKTRHCSIFFFCLLVTSLVRQKRRGLTWY